MTSIESREDTYKHICYSGVIPDGLCEIEPSQCPACHIAWDSLEDRNVGLPKNLLYGLSNNPIADFKIGDIAKIHVDVSDRDEEPQFTWIVEMVGGQVVALRGWHDYTGWDCQSGLRLEKYDSVRRALDSLVDWEREELSRQGRKDILP